MTTREDILRVLKDNNECLKGECHLCRVTKRCDVLYRRYEKNHKCFDMTYKDEYNNWVEYKRNGLTKYFIKMWGEDKLVEGLL